MPHILVAHPSLPVKNVTQLVALTKARPGELKSVPYVKSGRLKGIGVASTKRSPALPDLPALNESLKGFEADNWFGFMAPAGTPRDIVARFNAEVQKSLGSPELKDKLLAQGGYAHGGTPGQMGELIRADLSKWGKVVRAANIKIE